MNMLRSFHAVFLVCLTLAPMLAPAETMNALRRQLFSEVDKHLGAARKAHAEVLAPERFERAMKYYRSAEDGFRLQRNLEDVRQDIARADEWLARAMQATEISGITFAQTVEARLNALSADAPKFAAEPWREAEEALRKAAHEVEEGDIKQATSAASKVAALFQQAELTAIKNNYLSGARSLIAQADKLGADKYAIKTLVDARQLLQEAERELTENRYDTDYPRDLARRARNEAQHAITVTNLAIGVKKKDFAVEDIILNYERPLIAIAGAMNIVPSLHEGYEKTQALIVERARQLEKDSQELAQLRLVNEEQAAEIARLSEVLGIKSEQLAAEERYQALLADIEGVFQPSEAEIFRQGKNMIIRMIGLNFASGKAELERDHMMLLAKVKYAIDLSKTDLTTIEGHTDSHGGDESNLKLSQDRAQAVLDYLRGTLGITGNIKPVGYGETRPIANNETDSGRATNRRIDVVIQLEREKPKIGTL